MTFIAFEGIDGAGTTLQSKKIVERLQASSFDVVHTFEPSSGEIGKFIRNLFTRKDMPMPKWDTMALLFSADRLYHMDTVIAPALLDDKIVICERYDYSTLGYQAYYALEHHYNAQIREEIWNDVKRWICGLNKFAIRPDITFVLDVPAKVARDRMYNSDRSLDQFENKVQLQEYLAWYYPNLPEFFPHDNIYVVNSNRPKEDVTNELYALLQKEGVVPI